MRIITAIMILCLAVPATAQKKAALVLEVDKLYAKYKDKESIVIYTPEENLTANVKIEYNDKGKPYAVILYGPFISSSAINAVTDGLIKAKDKAGFKFQSNGSVDIPNVSLHSAQVLIYRKGTQYAIYGSEWVPSPFSQDSQRYFYFEVGDLARKGKGTTQPFTF